MSYSERASSDLERLAEFLQENDADPAAALTKIVQAIAFLREQPRLGPMLDRSGLRALVISSGKSGYVAHYRYVESEDKVLVVGVRHQRERRRID